LEYEFNVFLYTSNHLIRLTHTHTHTDSGGREGITEEEKKEKQTGSIKKKKKKKVRSNIYYHFDDKPLAHKSS
jgi:hypothetical protein